MENYIEYINYALKKNETIVFSARCEISYSGRAESFLPMGDRVIMIKSDNTLIVHQPTGNNPINYMKPESSIILSKEDEGIFLRARNLPMKEYMDIKVDKIHFANSHSLSDGQKIQVMGSERDMADMIYENPELISPDFRPLSMEEQTKYGFIDVFGHDKNGNLVIVECKRQNGDLSAVTQLRRYVEKIKEMRGVDNVKGILACPKITPNALQMLQDWGFEHVAVKPPNYRERFDSSQRTLAGFSR